MPESTISANQGNGERLTASTWYTKALLWLNKGGREIVLKTREGLCACCKTPGQLADVYRNNQEYFSSDVTTYYIAPKVETIEIKGEALLYKTGGVR